jgi:hypothetical protein
VLGLQQLLALGAAAPHPLAAGQVDEVEAAVGAGVGDLVGALHHHGQHLQQQGGGGAAGLQLDK